MFIPSGIKPLGRTESNEKVSALQEQKLFELTKNTSPTCNFIDFIKPKWYQLHFVDGRLGE